MPRIKITEDEHRLITRYREQARAYNEGVTAVIQYLSDGILADYAQGEYKAAEILKEINKLLKETI